MHVVMHAFGFLYDRLPGTYNGLVSMMGYRAPELVADAMALALKADLKPTCDQPAPKILDAGCGTGLTARAMLARVRGATLDGFDLSENMLAEAKKTGQYGVLRPADATQPLPFKPESYDGVVSSGLYTLGHVGPEALLPVLAVIKPGGLFALNIYDAAWEKLAFEEAINQLVADGLVTVRTHTTATHFGRLGQTCRVLVLEKQAT